MPALSFSSSFHCWACVFIDKKWLKFYFPVLNKTSSSDRLLGDKLPIFPVAQAACLCSSLSLTFAGGADQNQTKPSKWEPSGLILPFSRLCWNHPSDTSLHFLPFFFFSLVTSLQRFTDILWLTNRPVLSFSFSVIYNWWIPILT